VLEKNNERGGWIAGERENDPLHLQPMQDEKMYKVAEKRQKNASTI